MAKKPVEVMITAFRDGFQSVFGARVFSKDFLPAVEATRAAGIAHFEAGGGAMFQSLFFYCNENAFDAMDAFRAAAGPEANLQTLARGVNVVALDSSSSPIVDLHAKLFKKHGMTTIRNFDALNDVNNLIWSGQCIVNAGLKHEVCVTMMELPPGCEGAHTPEFYSRTLRNILDAGIPYHSVCFKDASGTAVPSKVYETIYQARQMLPEGTHIRFHTHETAGISVMGYRAALDAGADGIDLSMAPCSGGTCQPDIAVMWHALRGTEYDLGVDIEKMREAEEVFKKCMKDYFVPPEALAVEPMIPWAPMPGGALTANTQMMRDNGILDRYPEVIAAMTEVVRKGGFGSSVTPVSQFYFQQAFNNVMFGPWKRMVESYGRMVLGYFGKTPVPPDPEVVKIASEQLKLEPTAKTPLELNDADPKKSLEASRALLREAGLPETDENTFIAAACREKGIAFLKGDAATSVRKKQPEVPKPETPAEQPPAETAPAGLGAYTVVLNGKTYAVELKGDSAIVNGKTYAAEVRAGIEAIQTEAPKAAAPEPPRPEPAKPVLEEKKEAPVSQGEPVKSPMPGVVFRIDAAPGASVAEGASLVVLEAMKMEIPVKAQRAGVVASIAVAKGDQVTTGQVLAWLK